MLLVKIIEKKQKQIFPNKYSGTVIIPTNIAFYSIDVPDLIFVLAFISKIQLVLLILIY